MKPTYKCLTEGPSAKLRLVCCGRPAKDGCNCPPDSVTASQRRLFAAMKVTRPAAADPDDDTVSLSREEYEQLLADAASWQAEQAVAAAEAELHGPPVPDPYGLNLAVNRGAAKFPTLRPGDGVPDPYDIVARLAKNGRELGDRQFPIPRRPAGKLVAPHACAYGLDKREVA